MKPPVPSFALVLAVGLALSLGSPATPPAGPSVTPQSVGPAVGAPPVVRDQRLATFFFYWYDITTGAHIRNPDGSDALTDHPPDLYLRFFSYRDPLWFQEELQDMRSAGVDIVLPVFWGSDQESSWAEPGLENLVSAEELLLSQGDHPPKIGMFFDTSALRQQNGGPFPDLTTSAGRVLFYDMIARFFALVPADLRAEIGGRPVIYLYISYFAKAYDQGLFDFVYQSFEQEFGVRPFIVRESSWQGVTTDGEYSWGTALAGPRVFGPSGDLGPGFNNAAVATAVSRLYRDRECGEYYRDGWEAIIDSGAKQVAVETWNELHEGTDIAVSREYGRQYIDLTRESLRLWRQSAPPEQGVTWTELGRSPKLHGLHPAANAGDGTWITSFQAGREAAAPDSAGPSPAHYIYLNVRDDFIYSRKAEVWITVEYLDAGHAAWWVEYDGTAGPYSRTEPVTPQDSGLWKTRTFHVLDAYFDGRENFDADLRLATSAGPGPARSWFSRVWVSPAVLPGAAPSLDGWADLTVPPGASVGLPVTVVNPQGHRLSLGLDRGPSFCRVVDYGNGSGVLLASPRPADARECPYRVRVLVSDLDQPALADAQTLFLKVASPPPGPGARSQVERRPIVVR